MSPRSSRVPWITFVAGFALLVAASIWAPAQPELLNSGGACNVAMCGTLEDPQRWRAAWFAWGAGAVVTLVATVMLARPRAGHAWRRAGLAGVVVICIPVTAFVGALVSLGTSVQGFATTMWIGALLPLLTLAAAGARSSTGPRRTTSHHGREVVEPPTSR
jgi:hypothetical protein